MAKRQSNSKAKPNKGRQPFPLRLHGNGQWCKKIRGRRIYFGTDRDQALVEYHEYLKDLLSDKLDVETPGAPTDKKPEIFRDAITEYLHYQQGRVKIEEITETQYSHLRTGFYTLRRTGATLAAKSGDVFAVKGYLGHTGLDMATWYVQQDQLSPQTDRATDLSQELLAPVEPVRTPDSSAPSAGPGSDAAGDAARPAAGG